MKIRRTFLVVLAAAAVIAGTGCIGDPDPTFGFGGAAIANVPTNDRTEAIAVQPDGKVVVVGLKSDRLLDSPYITYTGSLVVRFNTDGTLDPSFGTGGKVVVPNASLHSVALTADGRIVLAGSVLSNGFARPDGVPLVAMLQSNGHYDTGFNSTGTLVPTFSNPYNKFESVTVRAGSAADHSDDEILVGGATGTRTCTDDPDHPEDAPTCVFDTDPFVADFARNGTPVASFGTSGVRVVPVPGAASQWTAASVSSSGTGLAFLARSYTRPFGCGKFTVRLTHLGAPDPAFSGDGIAGFSGAAVNLCGNDLAVGPGRKIVIVGGGTKDPVNGMPANCIATRLNADGSEDQTFGNSGARKFSFGPAQQTPGTQNGKGCELTAVAFDGDHIVAAGNGQFQPFGSFWVKDSLVVRFDATGAFDTTFARTGYKLFGNQYTVPVVDVAVSTRGYLVAFNSLADGHSSTGFPLAVARFISH
jgi:uncharacterized delta-60 repeat protein